MPPWIWQASGRDFYERVRNGYLETAENEAHRFVVLDGMRDVDEIARDIWKIVEKKNVVSRPSQ